MTLKISSLYTVHKIINCWAQNSWKKLKKMFSWKVENERRQKLWFIDFRSLFILFYKHLRLLQPCLLCVCVGELGFSCVSSAVTFSVNETSFPLYFPKFFHLHLEIEKLAVLIPFEWANKQYDARDTYDDDDDRIIIIFLLITRVYIILFLIINKNNKKKKKMKIKLNKNILIFIN